MGRPPKAVVSYLNISQYNSMKINIFRIITQLNNSLCINICTYTIFKLIVKLVIYLFHYYFLLVGNYVFLIIIITCDFTFYNSYF